MRGSEDQMKRRSILLAVTLLLSLAAAGNGATINQPDELLIVINTMPDPVTVVFMPDTGLDITAPFETAGPGDTIAGTVNAFNFTSDDTQFASGLYVARLEV